MEKQTLKAAQGPCCVVYQTLAKPPQLSVSRLEG